MVMHYLENLSFQIFKLLYIQNLKENLKNTEELTIPF